MALVVAFMHLYSIYYILYSIFHLQFVLSILVYIFFKSDIETPDPNGQWYQILLTLYAFFMRTVPKGLTFGLCL